jgi:hypothetical protein
MLFVILVLLVQYRNTLNDVKIAEKRRKGRRKPEEENNEVKDKTYITGKMRKILRF